MSTRPSLLGHLNPALRKSRVVCQVAHSRRFYASGADDALRAIQRNASSRQSRIRGWNAAFGIGTQEPNYLSPFAGKGAEKTSSGTGIGGSALSGRAAYNYARLGLCQATGNAYNEDRMAFDEIFVDGSSLFLLGVYDGHGGWQVAHYLERELLPAVKKELGLGPGQFATHRPSSLGDPPQRLPRRTRPVQGSVLLQAVTNPELIPTTTDPNRVEDALTKAFVKIDDKLKDKVSASIRLGFDRFVRIGSCACTVAVTETHYVVANAGDCRALLCRKGGQPAALSNVHSCDEAAERERLRRERPDEEDIVVCSIQGWLDPQTGELYETQQDGFEFIEAGCYLKEKLQPSRAFGDFALKDEKLNICFPGLPGEGVEIIPTANFEKGPYLSAVPEITTHERLDSDELVVLGSDGLFDWLSEEDICRIARQAGSPEEAAEALVDAVKTLALEENGMTESEYEAMPQADRREVHDDVTVCVFYLQLPHAWRDRLYFLSEKLQKLCDRVVKKGRLPEILWNEKVTQDLNFSVCIADPSLADCPLVAVSKGFETLTGYRVEDAIGRNCRFLSYGVPEDMYDEETTSRLRSFTDLAISGDPFADFFDFEGDDEEYAVRFPPWLPEELRQTGGGGFFVRWNRRRDGELFKNLFVLRQVWVGERTYIVALQTKLVAKPEPVEGEIQPLLTNKILIEVARLAEKISTEVAVLLPALVKMMHKVEAKKDQDERGSIFGPPEFLH